MTHRHLQEKRTEDGFTLIELLVVMAIIATLAGLGMYGIPRIMREADITACKSHLQEIHGVMIQYQSRYRGLSMASGPDFVLSIWNSGLVDHTPKDAEIFFCNSRKMEPAADLSNVVPELISYTGPDQQGRRTALGIQDRNANEKVIVCDRVPIVLGDEDLDDMPHAAKGICYLTLGGAADWIEAAEFGEYPIIGPDSPVDRLKWMVPDQN